MIRACSRIVRLLAVAVAAAALLPHPARATMEADPSALYAQMKSAYDRAAAHNFNFRDQEEYLSTVFNAGRAYSLQRPSDPAYAELAKVSVELASSLHYNPLTNHDAAVWYVREAAEYVDKSADAAPALRASAQALLERVNSEDSPERLAQLADADAAENARTYGGDTDARLQQLEADWRGWLLTRDASWRSLAFGHAALPGFPLANIPTTYGDEFLRAVQSAAGDGAGYTDGDRKNAQTIVQRFKDLKIPLIIATVRSMPHDAYLTTLAPADEYFGRMGYSVLGIQNELKHINFMLDYNYGNREAGQTVLVAEAIEAMHKVYPRDRDLPKLLLSCLTTLERMDAPQAKASAATLRSILTVEYQDSPEARTVLTRGSS